MFLIYATLKHFRFLSVTVLLHEEKIKKLLALGILITLGKLGYDVRRHQLLLSKSKPHKEFKLPHAHLTEEFTMKAVTVISQSTPEDIAQALTDEKARKRWDLNCIGLLKKNAG